jgi:hypothetical protein
MKKMILFILGVFFVFPLSAQEETLINGDIEHGAFGGPVLKLSQVNNDVAIFVGGRGGWIINHSFSIGAGGYGLANNIKTNTRINGEYRDVEFGYAGLEFEYFNEPEKLIHYSFCLLAGGGGIGYRDSLDASMSNRDKRTDAVFVLEPTMNVTLNVIKFFRVSIGANYRFIGGAIPAGTTRTGLSGPSASLTFRFGKF